MNKSLLRLNYFLVPFCLLLMSATYIEKKESASPDQTAREATIPVSANPAAGRLNFFQKLFYKFSMKKHKAANKTGANLASTSLILGIGAGACLVLGFAAPAILLATIPLGIAAFITGNSAIKQGTDEVAKAKVGKWLGLGSIMALAALFIIALIALSSSDWNFSWH